MMHDGCTFGGMFVAYGGLTKQKNILSDLVIYDIEANTWVKYTLPKNIDSTEIGPRFMHTLTSVVPIEKKTIF